VGYPRLNGSSVVHRRGLRVAPVYHRHWRCADYLHLCPDRPLSYGDKSACSQQLSSSWW